MGAVTIEDILDIDYDTRPDASFVRDDLAVVKDTQVKKKHFLRSVYNLVSYDSFYGTIIDFGEVTKVDSKDNRLSIYDGGTYKSAHYYQTSLVNVILYLIGILMFHMMFLTGYYQLVEHGITDNSHSWIFFYFF